MKDIIVPYFLPVHLKNDEGKEIVVEAKVDSGADNCSLDEKLAKELGLNDHDDVVAEADIVNANGVDKRPVIQIHFNLGGEEIKTLATVADRSELDCPFLIGRSALKNDNVRFLVDPLKKIAYDLRKLASQLRETNEEM